MAGFICILNLVMNGFSHQFLTYVIFHKSCCYLSFCFLLCAISIFLCPVVESCLWYTWPCAVCFRSSVSDSILFFSVVELCLWYTWPCAVSFRSSLSDTFLLLSVVEPFLWDTWPCALFFDVLYAICLCGLRLNLACEIHLLVVLFLFDLLCAISLSCLRLWNLACGIDVGLVLFIFDLLCAISLSGIRLLKFACEMEDDVVFFPLDLHGLTMGRLSGMHSLFLVYLQVNAIPPKFSTQSLREPCKSTSRIGEPCSSVFKEAQPRTSKQRVSVS